jgi:hypothetical protein
LINTSRDRLSIFIGGDTFEHRELLYVGHVPDIDQTVGRDEEISIVRRALGPGNKREPARDNNHIRENRNWKTTRYEVCVSRQAERG